MKLHPAVGSSVDEFWCFAKSSEYNGDFEYQKDPTPEYPSPEEFTHVFHYTNGVRDCVHRLMDDYFALWRSPTGEVLAAGLPMAVASITLGGLAEVFPPRPKGAIVGSPGPSIKCIWGPSSQHVFAAGYDMNSNGDMSPIVLQRVGGQWSYLDTRITKESAIHALSGFDERSVYAVGTFMHYYDGRTFTEMDAPTDDGFTYIVRVGRRLCATASQSTALAFGDRTGWRAIPTPFEIYALASWNDLAYLTTSDGLYSFDGQHSPALVLKRSVEYVSGLSDGLVLSSGEEAWTWDGKTLRPLDTIL